jgi:hypothetical protein
MARRRNWATTTQTAGNWTRESRADAWEQRSSRSQERGAVWQPPALSREEARAVTPDFDRRHREPYL